MFDLHHLYRWPWFEQLTADERFTHGASAEQASSPLLPLSIVTMPLWFDSRRRGGGGDVAGYYSSGQPPTAAAMQPATAAVVGMVAGLRWYTHCVLL